MSVLETRITPSTNNLEGVVYLPNGSKFVFTADKFGTLWIEKWESFVCNGSVKVPAETVVALKEFLEQATVQQFLEQATTYRDDHA